VLLSPGYLASPRARRGLERAERRERLRSAGSPAPFISVLRIRDTPPLGDGTLIDREWLDVTNPESVDAELGRLVSVVEQGKRSAIADQVTSPSGPSAAGELPVRQGARLEEMDRALRGLMSARGPHFWLVVAPPRMGKSTFLDQVSELMAADYPRWVTSRVDVGREPPEVRADPEALLARLFSPEAAAVLEQQPLRVIAQEISRRGRPYLCLLDSAELLTEETSTALRSALSEVYRLVQRTGNADVRLAFVVASRRDDEWRGVRHGQRFSTLSLDELDVEVIEDALRDLAGPGRQGTYSSEQFHQMASFVHRLTYGLPDLLGPFLEWIRAEEWLEIDRLEGAEVFTRLAGPYVDGGLLTRDSLFPLFPHGSPVSDERLRVVEMAVRRLARYRFFTQSHLRDHLDQDGSFQQALEDARWSIEDLWDAVSSTALLKRPLDEPWQEFHAAIRRLLFRYFYTSPGERVEAHGEARKLVEKWVARQSGKEQVIGIVECLWHQASALCLVNSAMLHDELINSAEELSEDLRRSGAYTVSELRSYAAGRIADDDELRETLSRADGLTERLIRIIAGDHGSSGHD